MKFAQKFFATLFIIGLIYGVVILATHAQVSSDSRQVDLHITAPSFISYIQVDNDADFSSARIFDVASTIRVDVCDGATLCPAGDYTMHVRYVDADGLVRHVAQQTVAYAPAPQPVEPEPEPIVAAEPEITEPATSEADSSGPTADNTEPQEPEPVAEPIPEVTPVEPVPAPVRAQWAETPTTQAVVGTVAAVGVAGSAAAGAASMVMGGLQLQQLGLAFVRLWNLVLVFLGIRRRSQPWGVVFDSQTKQPLDPVYVELLDTEGNQVATSITDIYGRYGFFVEKSGQYFLRAGKTHYAFPSDSKRGAATDMFYDELYYGTPLELEPGQVITQNIPMDRAGEDWNQEEKTRMKVGGVSPWVAVLTKMLYYIGLVFTVVTALLNPSTLGIVFLILYAVMQMFELLGLKTKSFGVVRDADSGQGVGHAVIAVMNAALDHRVARAESDEKGRYYVLVPKGEYYLRVEEVDGKKLKKPLVTETFRVRGGMVTRGLVV